MARELHDIVLHNLSVVVVQAAGARAQAEQRDPGPATLEKIERSGREALIEMRRMLGVLREDDGAHPAVAPHPQGSSNCQGSPNASAPPAWPSSLNSRHRLLISPPAIDLSTYRNVQELSPNTLKHAGPAALFYVRVHREPQALTIEVVDDGRGSVAATSPDRHGLLGMRERATITPAEPHTPDRIPSVASS